MSRSSFHCRHCREPLGEIKPSGILHLAPGVSVVFIDQRQGVTILLCVKCAQRIRYTGGRIEPDRRTA